MSLGRVGQCQTIACLREIITQYVSENRDFENLGIGPLVFLPLPGTTRLMRSLCLVVLVHNRWVMAPWAKQCDIRKVTGGEKGEVSLPAFRVTVWHRPISIGWPLQWSDGFMVNGGTSLSAHLSGAYFPIRFIFLLHPIRWCWVYLVNQLQKQKNDPITWEDTRAPQKTTARGRQWTHYGAFLPPTDKDRVVVGSGGRPGVTRSAGTPFSHWKGHCWLRFLQQKRVYLWKRDGNPVLMLHS